MFHIILMMFMPKYFVYVYYIYSIFVIYILWICLYCIEDLWIKSYLNISLVDRCHINYIVQITHKTQSVLVPDIASTKFCVRYKLITFYKAKSYFYWEKNKVFSIFT